MAQLGLAKTHLGFPCSGWLALQPQAGQGAGASPGLWQVGAQQPAAGAGRHKASRARSTAHARAASLFSSAGSVLLIIGRARGPHPGDPLMPVTSVAVAGAECCSFSTGAPRGPQRAAPASQGLDSTWLRTSCATHPRRGSSGAPELSWAPLGA